MITVVKEFTFDSAHSLPKYDGKCQNLHGHTYKLQVAVCGENLVNGILVDFHELNALVKEHILEGVDHKHLNDVFTFETTAENLATFFYHKLDAMFRFKGKSFSMKFIRLWETPTCFVEYSEV